MQPSNNPVRALALAGLLAALFAALAGCSNVQGFLMGRPAGVEIIDELVAAEHVAAKRVATA